MNNQPDRRSAGKRVSFGSLVEICGNEPGGPAFEAETLDVSAAGMHVRTAYLPEEGAPLVCRFHDRDREIIVEGVVAWRHAEARGGEFGVQFTALDSGSVDALRELTEESVTAEDEAAPAEAPRPSVDAGSKVRLHIDGLGAPMKARVRAGVGHRLDVGSNLEFLRVGRELTLESLEGGAKRSARIEAVSVAVDPGTNVPQLVVALRYADVEGTPLPTTADADPVGTHRSPAVAGADPRPAPEAAALRKAESLSHPPPALAPEEEAEAFFEQAPAPGTDDDELPMLRSRFGAAAGQAGELATAAGKQAADLGGRAARGIGRWVGQVTSKVRERHAADRGADRAEPALTRRTTALPGAGATGMESRRLRPQAGGGRPVQATAAASSVASGPDAARRRMRRMGISAAGIALLALIGVVALGKPSTPPGAEGATAEAAAVEPAAPATTVAAAVTDPAIASAVASATDPQGGVVANVPLFGATPMATVEPAPLEGPMAAAAAEGQEEEGEEGAAPPVAAAKGDVVASAPELEAPEDEAFPDAAKPAEAESKKVDPRDVKPWGRGTVREPTIHRLRLDASGAAIQGAITPTGFTVVIPGRQVMETGKVIAKRDSRIAKVRTANTAAGAQIAFSFRDGVPGYKVRLRKDFVEILISAPEKKEAGRKKEAKKPAERIARATP